MLKTVKLLPKIDINNINKIQIIIIAGIEAIAHLPIKITIEENGILKSLIATFCSFFSFNISHKNIPKYLLYHIKISFVNEKTFEITTSERNYELFGIKFITLNA